MKLTDEQLHEARAAISAGATILETARRMGVSYRTMRRRLDGWKARATTAGLQIVASIVIRSVASEAGIPSHRLLAPDRTRGVVAARHRAIRRLANDVEPRLSAPQIADLMGLDHSTVLYALGRLSSRLPRTMAASQSGQEA